MSLAASLVVDRVTGFHVEKAEVVVEEGAPHPYVPGNEAVERLRLAAAKVGFDELPFIGGSFCYVPTSRCMPCLSHLGVSLYTSS